MVTPNAEFAKEMADAGCEGAKLCFQCGTCTASCPSGRLTSYRIRKLIRQTQLGLKEVIVEGNDLWDCTTCYACEERCPRDVPIVDIIISLRNIAVAEGHMFDGHKATAKSFYSTGHTVSFNDKVKTQRDALGLSGMPPTVLGNSKAMEDLKKILDATNFNTIVE
ncbi:MAG TPA: CoB--CoM heterodisulfide reductase subunit C [Candidatus Methanomethylophilaceae archaeon]|nr:CoB--CoM heterodisulfide reductase subunit C [Candidatus Methanomethylophilaceae archaeon]